MILKKKIRNPNHSIHVKAWNWKEKKEKNTCLISWGYGVFFFTSLAYQSRPIIKRVTEPQEKCSNTVSRSLAWTWGTNERFLILAEEKADSCCFLLALQHGAGLGRISRTWRWSHNFFRRGFVQWPWASSAAVEEVGGLYMFMINFASICRLRFWL